MSPDPRGPVQSKLSSYEIREIAATGAYGVVCVAREPGGDDVAIKVLQLDQATQELVLQRARDEARMLSRLDHPNLVRVDPVIQVNGRPAVVMEYVRGATLEQVLRLFPDGLPLGVALGVIRDAALGLDAAWSTAIGSDNRPMHIVHRDIKPGNLMLSIAGVLKVVDFGLAKASFADREAHSMAFVPGSRGFMAPERYDGEDTPKGDVYALGLSLFELVSGKKALVSLRMDKHDNDVARACTFVTDSTLDPPVLDEVRALVQQMVRYEPDQRPWPIEIARRIEGLLETHGLQPDLLAFAAQVVAPMYDSRPRLAPEDHPSWPVVRFLEAEPTGEQMDVTAELARLIHSSDFPGRAAEVAALLAANPGTDVTPLVSMLDQASVPPWQFWRKTPSTAQTIAALRALGPLRHADALDRARRLVRHRNRHIADAAREMLGRA